MVKILFIRFSSIGDIILTTPLLRNLKLQMKDVEIHYLTKKAFFEVLKHNPYLSKIHLLDHNLNSLIKTLRNESFDYIIDLHNNARSFRIKSSLRRLSFSFNKLNFQKWLLVNFKVNLLPELHIVDRYFNTLHAFDIVNDNLGLDYFYDESEIREELKKMTFINSKYIAFAIGARHFTKKLPTPKIIEICNNLELPVVLLGDENDRKQGAEISDQSTNTVHNCCGNYSLNASIHILKNAQLVLSHDTGLMHIAAAYQKKIISIWGNTVPAFGMYPYLPQKQDNFVIIEVNDLSCRPCSKIGFNKCPKGHFKCMNNILTDQVIEKSKQFLQ